MYGLDASEIDVENNEQVQQLLEPAANAPLRPQASPEARRRLARPYQPQCAHERPQ